MINGQMHFTLLNSHCSLLIFWGCVKYVDFLSTRGKGLLQYLFSFFFLLSILNLAKRLTFVETEQLESALKIGREEISMQKITPFLWFDDKVEEATRFYTFIFKNSKIGFINYYGEDKPRPKKSI